jgi:hypothetical protein
MYALYPGRSAPLPVATIPPRRPPSPSSFWPANTLLRPLVNYINRIPVDARSARRNSIHALCRLASVPDVGDLLFDIGKRALPGAGSRRHATPANRAAGHKNVRIQNNS